MWVLPALMALALLPTVKNTLSGVCLSFHVAGTASIIRAVKTVQEVYNWDGVESVVATALMHENKVVINANW